MIINFEEQTHELTDYEKNELLPVIVKGLKTKSGKSNVISSTEIIKALKTLKYKIDPARLRKIINYIRVNNVLYNLIATGNGYYIATTPQECRDFIKSLDRYHAWRRSGLGSTDFHFSTNANRKHECSI